MKKTIHTVLFLISCLLLTACGQKSGKWLIWGVDIKTEMGIRPNPVETFDACMRHQRSISIDELKKLFDREAAIVAKNRSVADWGNVACLAFNESATVFQVKTAASLLPDEELSSEEQMVIGLLRALLNRRAITLSRLDELERKLDNSLAIQNKLKMQVVRLQEIEGLLERK